jgi:chaperonin GroES
MKFKAVLDRILVRPIEETKTRGGLYLLSVDKTTMRKGVILEAGPGQMDAHNIRKPIQVKKGDEIYFQPNDGVEIEIDGEKLLVMKEEDVECVVTA